MLKNFRTFQTFFYKEYFKLFTLLFLSRKINPPFPYMLYVLKRFVWLPIIETIYPSNLRTFQPVDDFGGIHLLIVMLALCQSSIQNRTFRTPNILGSWKHPS